MLAVARVAHGLESDANFVEKEYAMATKRPAKLAINKKVQQTRICPETGKPMVAVKVLRKNNSSGMMWVVLDEFNGTEQAVQRMLPIR